MCGSAAPAAKPRQSRRCKDRSGCLVGSAAQRAGLQACYWLDCGRDGLHADGRAGGLKNKGLHSRAQQIFLVEERVST